MFPQIVLLVTLHVAVGAHRFHVHYGSSLIDFYNATFLESFKRGFLYNAFFDSADDPLVNKSCIDHLRRAKEALLSMEPWTLKLIDSSGEFQTSSSSGNLINLGSYDECFKIRTVQYNGKYCKIKIIFNDSPMQNSSFVPYNVPLVFTFCAPDSCGNSDLKKLLLSADFNATYWIDCAESNPTYTVAQILWICFCIIIVFTTISSTAYDIFAVHNYEGINALLSSFSVMRNNTILFRNDSVGIPCINGLRYFCQLLVVFAHYWMHLMKNEIPIVNKFDLYEIVKSWKGSLIVNFALTPDIFFSISGFILSFTFLKNGSPSFNPFRLCALRYLRLFPAYLAVVFYTSTFFDKMCSGPLCSVEVTRNYRLCQQFWWTNVIGISNIYPGVVKSCLPHGWFIAAEMQIFIIFAPLTMYLMRSSIRATYSILIFLMAWSIFAAFMISSWYELPIDNYEFETEKYVEFRTLYSAPYTRVKSWIVGVLIGMITHSFSNGNNSYPCKTFQIALWLTCGLSFLISTGSTFVIHAFNSSYVTAALVTSIQGVLLSVSTCCVIFACSMKFGGVLNNILTWSPLIPLCKLSYSLYIVHMPIIYLFFGSIGAPIDLSLVMQLPVILGLLLLSHLAAWTLFVTVEMPANHIVGYFFRKKILAAS